MSKQEQIKIAEQYVNEQLKTIEAYRESRKTKISKEEYQQTVQKVADAIICK
jgi:RNase H-fold protein (predicted Holliday junction resolvase)